jgi:hypothetical protein
MAESAGATLIWEIDAPSSNAAMRALYEHLGYGPYQPMLRPDGTPYPEDEDDEIRERLEAAYSSALSVVCPTASQPVLLPRNPSVEDIARGYFEWDCTACGQSHTMRFRRTGAE